MNFVIDVTVENLHLWNMGNKDNAASEQLNKDLMLNTIQMLDADIVLGNPKHNCRYYGICEIKSIEASDSHSGCSTFTCLAKTKLYLNENDELVVLFEKKSLSDVAEQHHFNKVFFTISESVNVPSFVSDFLNTSYMIHSGKYFITKDEEYYKVVFKRESDWF